jgi:hypothetical protein
VQLTAGNLPQETVDQPSWPIVLQPDRPSTCGHASSSFAATIRIRARPAKAGPDRTVAATTGRAQTARVRPYPDAGNRADL